MANTILVLGKPGSGKTTSIRNLNSEETYVISIINKDLPLPGWRKKYFPSTTEKKGNYQVIFGKDFTLDRAINQKDAEKFAKTSEKVCGLLRAISKDRLEIKTIIIDDSQYLMGYEVMARASSKGYEKFNELAYNFFSIIPTAQSLRDDLSVIFLHHVDDSDKENRRAKTIGKMIDNTITLEGMFTTVLFAESRSKNLKTDYYFVTNSDGTNTAKSPMGMFDTLEIPNDLKLVLDTIKIYNN